MRFCISLPVSLEGVGSDCWLSCHDKISRDETQDWSFCWDYFSASRLAQSASFKYCSIVILAVFGSPDVEGILDVCFWIPGPVMHMIWGTEVVVSSGKRFTVVCPVFHKASPYLRRAVSPDHNNSHCSFEMSFQIWCGSWCLTEVSRISSIRLFRIRRHTTSLYQTLTVVSSHDPTSSSRVISVFDLYNHSYMTRWRLFFMI